MYLAVEKVLEGQSDWNDWYDGAYAAYRVIYRVIRDQVDWSWPHFDKAVRVADEFGS